MDKKGTYFQFCYSTLVVLFSLPSFGVTVQLPAHQLFSQLSRHYTWDSWSVSALQRVLQLHCSYA